MILKRSAGDVSLALTSGSLLLALASVGLGRRVNYLEYLAIFNSLAATMLGLACLALVVAAVPLARSRGRGGSLWLAVVLAITVIGLYLLDG